MKNDTTKKISHFLVFNCLSFSVPFSSFLKAFSAEIPFKILKQIISKPFFHRMRNDFVFKVKGKSQE